MSNVDVHITHIKPGDSEAVMREIGAAPPRASDPGAGGGQMRSVFGSDSSSRMRIVNQSGLCLLESGDGHLALSTTMTRWFITLPRLNHAHTLH